MNTLLTKFTEEKRARTELEELVSHLEEKNKELVSECEKLRDLVDDLLPSSKVWIHVHTSIVCYRWRNRCCFWQLFMS